jgi:5'-nucleotidase
MTIRRLLPLLGLALLAACATTQTAPRAPVVVGIAAINDFHGSLEPPKQSVVAPDGKGGFISVPAGGAAWLASAVDTVRAKYRHQLTVSAGDLIGGTPIVSSLYVDEPAIGVMNRIGLDFNAVGNHELDYGVDELLRKQNGGCAQHTARKPCQIEQFAGAKFRFLAGNTATADGRALFPGTALRSFGAGNSRVTVGLIGLTLKGTGGLLPPETAAGLSFADEADSANALASNLKAKGADAIVLLIHQGGRTTGDPGPNSCNGLTYEIRTILDRLDPRIDVVVSGHTHWDYVCDYAQVNPAKPFLLTSAGLWGKLVTDITLEIDPVANRVVAKRANNVIVQSLPYRASVAEIANTDIYPRFTPRADVAEYVARYVEAAASYSRRKVGTVAAPIERASGALSNTGGPLGMLVADAQLAATTGAGAQIALTNPFGVRRTLNAAPDGTVTFGDLYAVQPFGNDLVTQSLTGAELKTILEQGFDADAPEQVLTPSVGFAYAYDRGRPVGERISGMTLNGVPIDPARTYRVTSNEFLANGGDSFEGFRKGRDRVKGISDIVALEAWLQAVPPRAAPRDARTTDLHPELNPNRGTAPPGQVYR